MTSGKFHSKCGQGITLSKDRKTAGGRKNSGIYGAFSDDPITNGLQFSVKIVEHQLISPLSASPVLHPPRRTLRSWRCCACSSLLPILCIL